MALETGTFINSLNAANPASTDGLAQADDHMRLIKSTIKSTFPNIDGAMNATEDELNVLDGITATTAELNLLTGVTASTAEINYLDGVTSNIQTQIDSKVATGANVNTLVGTTSAQTVPVDGNGDDNYLFLVVNKANGALVAVDKTFLEAE